MSINIFNAKESSNHIFSISTLDDKVILKNNLLKFFETLGFDSKKQTHYSIVILELLNVSKGLVKFYLGEKYIFWEANISKSYQHLSLPMLTHYSSIPLYDGWFTLLCAEAIPDIKAIETQEFKVFRECLTMNIEQSTYKEIEQKRLLAKQSKQAQMGEMISMIAHQWRQPLSAIAATVLDMKLDIELDCEALEEKESREKFLEKSLDSLADIEIFVTNLSNTIDDFRTFYKPGKQAISTLIEKPIQKALHIVRASMEAKGIVIKEDMQSKEKVYIHESEIMQVILNILKNAQDNFEEKRIQNPLVSIYSRDLKNGVSVKITDNGGGIPDMVLPRIFEPYFSTKEERNGTGLGLYMSKMIVEEHHKGSLDAENYKDGVCFIMNLIKGDKQIFEPVYRLVYTSFAKYNFSKSDIEDMLEVSKRNNKRKNISGILIYHRNAFFQILEGKKEEVDALFELIQHDRRHEHVHLIGTFENMPRIFKNWSMGYGDIKDSDFKDIEGFDSLFATDNWVDKINDLEVEHLVFAFEKGKWRNKIK